VSLFQCRAHKKFVSLKFRFHIKPIFVFLQK
jgi:hypothetical protein